VLQRNSQLQQLALRKKEHQVIFSLSSAFLLLLVGVLLYRNLRGKHRLLKQSEELQNQRIQELETERKLVAAQSLMKGQEQERSRLAKDLHDGVGGLLSGMKLSLSTMSGNQFLSEENARAVDNIIGQLDNSINELRRVSHNMMPEALIKYGLKEALENYCERIDHSGQLSVRLQTYGLERRMEQDTEIVLYRIIQELLTNVIKHAEAKEVLIQLVREADKISLTVEDDGKGFDIHGALEKKGAGLQNIQARAGYLDGILDIRTSPGEGTSVTIEGTVK
jgi:signal transduction histidine kinase